MANLDNAQHLVAVGDIHGCFEALSELLQRSGCERRLSRFQPPAETHFVFLGDLIDRGLRSRECVAVVRELVARGDATCLLGNHEFNAVQYHLHDPANPARPMREHSEKNREQIAQTLASYAGHQEALDSDLSWFRSLPVALEHAGLRCVHACWDQNALEQLVQTGNKWHLPEGRWVEAGRQGTAAFEAIEMLCKGPEAPMPNQGFYRDKSGHPRYKARVAWWNSQPRTWRSYFQLPATVHGFDADAECWAIEKDSPLYQQNLPPVVFGHYWMTGNPQRLAANAACLDYSVAKGGNAVAYRHRAGAVVIDNHAFVSVPASS